MVGGCFHSYSSKCPFQPGLLLNCRVAFLTLWGMALHEGCGLNCSRCGAVNADHQMSAASVYAVQEKVSGKHSVSRVLAQVFARSSNSFNFVFLFP